jgi:uncharacterized protein YndB with AHSA1/START domain
MRYVTAAACLALTACAFAPAPTRGIVDSSFTEPDGSRTIQLSVWLPASPSEVYRAVATADGWKTWAATSVFGEPKLNGIMETSYSPDAKAGDPANIVQQFLALVPTRLAVFRTIRTPPGFPNAELYMKTVAIFQLEPEASGTRLLFTHQGFGKEPGFDQLYAFFLKGDAQTLESLQKVFSK